MINPVIGCADRAFSILDAIPSVLLHRILKLFVFLIYFLFFRKFEWSNWYRSVVLCCLFTVAAADGVGYSGTLTTEALDATLYNCCIEAVNT